MSSPSATPAPASDASVDALVVNTIKALAIDAVEAAQSGHPGMPMGMADAASVLWRRFLTVDPTAPDFADRDRFVLSAGHGSMLLYALLHLAGFDLPLSELRRFRQLGSKTPGHPEHGLTPGVETTTGPLGQGLGNAVGMAMAAEYLAAMFNRPGFPVVDHHIFGICSDGDLQEGLSHEAASLAGHLGLGRLVFLYDDNNISIDGDTELSFTDDTTGRFEAYGWQVLSVDGHDQAATAEALAQAIACEDKPSLVRCRTHIGHGSPNKQDSASSHGSPLGAEEARLTKEAMGWPLEPTFIVPEQSVAAFEPLRQRGAARRATWEAMMARYRDAWPELAAAWETLHTGDGLPADLERHLPSFDDTKSQATRASSGAVLAALAPVLPTLWGGSADLAGSNNTMIKGQPSFQKASRSGRNLHFGVREHGMAAAMNGMALHGGVIPYGGTFLTFSDYMRPSMRLAALMKQRAIFVLTHDSIFLGEDGPTHQSIEHAMALRLIPGLDVMRPADGRETAAAWLAALRRSDGPTALLLTRQGLPQLEGTRAATEGVARGAYVVAGDPDQTPELILIGTGSELHLCTHAAEVLAAEGRSVRVVSMPCAERFLRQPAAWRDAVLPPACKRRLSVEAGRTFGWERFVGDAGRSVGVDTFGESAPADALAELFGINADHVLACARELLAPGS
ncbi:MAG: transketolase [Deltaproteobacteria bacterium]|nr:transketolase [Deltaproteobacteria bacterium]